MRARNSVRNACQSSLGTASSRFSSPDAQLFVGDGGHPIGEGDAFQLGAGEPVGLLVKKRHQQVVARDDLFDLAVDCVPGRRVDLGAARVDQGIDFRASAESPENAVFALQYVSERVGVRIVGDPASQQDVDGGAADGVVEALARLVDPAQVDAGAFQLASLRRRPAECRRGSGLLCGVRSEMSGPRCGLPKPRTGGRSDSRSRRWPASFRRRC